MPLQQAVFCWNGLRSIDRAQVKNYLSCFNAFEFSFYSLQPNKSSGKEAKKLKDCDDKYKIVFSKWNANIIFFFIFLQCFHF